jgi:hypothetical protein
MTFYDLPEADRHAAIDGYIADVILVAGHVLGNGGDGHRDYYPVDRKHGRPWKHPWDHTNSPTIKALLASLQRREFPPLDVLEKMIAWVCFMTSLREGTLPRFGQAYRPLSAHEILVRDAAWRISDAIHKMRVEYVPRPVSSLSPGTD